jgi:hypothetical protein
MAITRLRGLGAPGLNMNLMGPNLPGSKQPSVNTILAPAPEVGVPVGVAPTPEVGMPVTAVTPPYPKEVPRPGDYWTPPPRPVSSWVDTRTPAEKERDMKEGARIKAENEAFQNRRDQVTAYAMQLLYKFQGVVMGEADRRARLESEGGKDAWKPSTDADKFKQDVNDFVTNRFGPEAQAAMQVALGRGAPLRSATLNGMGAAPETYDYKAAFQSIYDRALAALISAGYLPAGAGGGGLGGIDPLYIALGLGVVALFFFKGD